MADVLSSVSYSGVEAAQQINRYAAAGIPFVFAFDYEGAHGVVCPLEQAERCGIYFSTPRVHTIAPPVDEGAGEGAPLRISVQPPSKAEYARAFHAVQAAMARQEVKLINLTFPSAIRVNRSLAALYNLAQAPYKILCGAQFLCFSPECFVRMGEGTIRTYPMKGTISALVPNAEQVILSNRKEQLEHADAVALLKDDLQRVATDVEVVRYRFITRIETHKGPLLEVSSELSGRLPEDWRQQLGTLLFRLLPGGSIAGYPREAAVRLIAQVEPYPRHYYSGIFGVFDGEQLDSGVLIRYMGVEQGQLYYHSGGGVTANSHLENEYQELIAKIYVPVL